MSIKTVPCSVEVQNYSKDRAARREACARVAESLKTIHEIEVQIKEHVAILLETSEAPRPIIQPRIQEKIFEYLLSAFETFGVHFDFETQVTAFEVDQENKGKHIINVTVPQPVFDIAHPGDFLNHLAAITRNDLAHSPDLCRFLVELPRHLETRAIRTYQLENPDDFLLNLFSVIPEMRWEYQRLDLGLCFLPLEVLLDESRKGDFATVARHQRTQDWQRELCYEIQVCLQQMRGVPTRKSEIANYRKATQVIFDHLTALLQNGSCDEKVAQILPIVMQKIRTHFQQASTSMMGYFAVREAYQRGGSLEEIFHNTRHS